MLVVCGCSSFYLLFRLNFRLWRGRDWWGLGRSEGLLVVTGGGVVFVGDVGLDVVGC